MIDLGHYYEQLIGATITGFELIEDEYALNPFPCYYMTMEDGTKLKVEVSRDEEGNGGGMLFITENKIEGSTKRAI